MLVDSDLFLFLHCTSSVQLAYATNLIGRPFSVRDQSVRAKLLVERLHASKRIAKDRPLLILGSGFSGITAAMTAVGYGVPVFLFDQIDLTQLPLQHKCKTRWIDFCLYDWPEPTWRSSKWHGLPSVSASLESGWAKDVSAQYKAALDAMFTGPSKGLISFRKIAALPTPTDLVAWRDGQVTNGQEAFSGLTETSDLLLAYLTLALRQTEKIDCAGGVLLDCRGLLKEKTEVASAKMRTPEFWDNDLLNGKFDYKVGDRERILISGGGDGALQDALRVIFPGITTRILVESLAPKISLLDLETRLLGYYLSWKRHASALGNTRPASHFNSFMQEVCANAVTEIFKDASARTAAIDVFNRLVRVHPKNCSVRLVLRTRRRAFDECYPLNRFLVLLAIQYLKEPALGFSFEHWIDSSAELDLAPRSNGVFSATSKSEVFDQVFARHGADSHWPDRPLSYFDLPVGSYDDFKIPFP